ncbi:HAD-IIIA family hydrolase [Bacillus mycoides]|uniref:KdsC family phosphatase n=1 Tax=Bacillus mycoides TaxID=1405 RepID=UPI001C00E503|nr:HAD-IIIA family hydrolase [Bacillus mycoides]QWG73463.1 HAD-IIIA family hydrolase [Bacillus mycoides]QWH25754.1 HAD-IIIA family hydrolase [Bacillus mycoides]
MKSEIKLIVLDVDGVLTDGSLLIGSHGNEYKSFNVKDGMGISLARYAGIKFAIITGRKSEAVTIRAKELGIDFVYQGIKDKQKVLQEIIELLNIDRSCICFMGDDINDYSIIREVGISFAPSDAVDYIKEIVTYVTTSKGGHGAVREMIEVILKKQLDYNNLIKDYLNKKENIIQ